MSKKSISSAQTKSESPLTPSQKAAREPALALLRELVKTYQAFYTYDDAHVRQLGLTMPQFDVIATLGNTPGMMMSQLAEKTLVTKGTLTGIVDRLEQKGLVRREVPPDNRRCFIVLLTPAGQQLFEDIFPAHIDYLKQRLSSLSDTEIEQLQANLCRLRQLF
ncbi:MAG: MarR family transcriptional regulator [Leptolyngbyaceae cyanobacterium bins.349]|nr:MarR family transcriptional regulator [Leptolyngbyaceae cyanobacterium bins.349]